MTMTFDEAMRAMPLVAILRGLDPEHAVATGGILVEAGFTLIEVPLNSPDPLVSIGRLADAFGGRAFVGAGTVLEPRLVAEVARVGGRLIVMPHGDTDVIGAAVAAGLVCTPGVATPTEGFAALRAGARALKLFPAETMGPATLKAWRAVFPQETRFMPVGGITPETMAGWREAGANGFGIGGALFKPGIAQAELRTRADRFVGAWRALAA